VDSALPITNVGIALAPRGEMHRGLLAWASVDYGGLRFDGLAIRRRLDGEVIVTYPARKDGSGGLHHAITPLDPELDRRIRAAVLGAYLDARRKAGREDRQ
jgi:hypothetical protein